MKQFLSLLALFLAFNLSAQVPVSFSFQVLDGADDAEESTANGAMNLSSTDLELTRENTVQLIGIRFANIQIPAGATINSAFIQFTADETDNEPTNLTLTGELTANSAPFSNTDFDISNRPNTSAMVSWNEIPEWDEVGESGVDQQTPDLTAIIQEIVNQDGWAPGNALSIVISGDGKRVVVSNNGSASASAVLVVNYELDEFIVQPFPVNTASIWKYDDTGVALDTIDWTSLEYDDSAWAFGQAKFGFGDDNENTTLDFGPDENNKIPTYYFRKAFSVADPTGIDSITLSLLRDDGAIVYLNGVEVFRSNMPEGEVTFSTPASSPVSGADEGQFFNTKIPANLNEGMNILAVEVHQATAQSSDLGFDLSTTPEVTLPPAVQLVHNSPDPSLLLVSIWVDAFNLGNFVNFTGDTPIPFRFASDYITDLPQGTHTIAIAPFGTEDYEWSATEITIENNKRYIAMAAGVRDTSLFNTSVNGGEAIQFQLVVNEVPGPDEVEAGEVLPLLFHGTPDLPNIRLIAVGVGDATAGFPTGLPYGLPPVGGGVDAVTFPRVQVSNNATTEIYSEHKVDLVPFEQEVVVITTSGFFSPEGNTNVNASNYGVFVIPPVQSPFIELPEPDPAAPGTLEIIHNSPDPSLAFVDLYLNGNLAIDSLAYLSSTGRFEVPAGTQRVAISPSGVVDTAWSAFDFEVEATLNTTTFSDEGLDYTAVAFGVRNTENFSNEANADVSFGVAATQARTQANNDTDTDILFFHGGVDAPGIDLILGGEVVPIVNNLTFSNFSPIYVSLPSSEDFQVSLTDQDDNDVLLFTYDLDLDGLDGRAVTAFAAGLVAPQESQSEFGVFVATGDAGPAVALPLVIVDNIAELKEAGIEIFPNPVVNNLQIKSPNGLEQIHLTDLQGKILSQFKNTAVVQDIPVSQLPAGTYILSIRHEQKSYTVQIIKQ